MTDKQPTGYKSHRPGSRKGEVHRLFDTKGPEAAEKWALAQELKPATVKSWFADWKRADAGKKAKAADKPARKPKSDKKKDGNAQGKKLATVNAEDGRQTVTSERSSDSV